MVLLPVQPPDAVQDVALLEVQLSVALPPEVTEVGLAVSDTLGAVGVLDVTLTVTDLLTDPPAPVHVSVYVLVEVKLESVCEPAVALLPLQPPDAVQDVALLDDHVRTELPPDETDVGEALRLKVGAGVELLPAFHTRT
jgi:hypothetical protein